MKPGQVVPINRRFTTTKAHFELAGGTVLELFTPEALNTQSASLFKGNMDMGRLKDAIEKAGAANVSFVRMEATTNLLGGSRSRSPTCARWRPCARPPAARARLREQEHHPDHPRDHGRGRSLLPVGT